MFYLISYQVVSFGAVCCTIVYCTTVLYCYIIKKQTAALHSTILCSIGPACVPHDSVRYLRMYLVDSVLPAPDSPLTMIDWSHFSMRMSRYALSAAASNHNTLLADVCMYVCIKIISCSILHLAACVIWVLICLYTGHMVRIAWNGAQSQYFMVARFYGFMILSFYGFQVPLVDVCMYFVNYLV